MIQPSKAVSICNFPFSLLFYCLQKLYPKPMLDQGHSPTKGRCIALYPGAFRPPHAAHFFAVRYLLTQPHIDEVVVIISNRCRPIAGTTLALDATIAQQIWSLYLRGIKKVRVEVAPLTAVGHAFEYFECAAVGDTLLFCLGETDIDQGDDRFRNLTNLSKQSGIKAGLIQAPTRSLPIRSTSLRAALIRGDEGRKDFFSALPIHLTDEQRDEVWGICQKGIREMSDVSKDKVHAFIVGTGLGEIEDLQSAGQRKLDQVFRVRLKGGRCLFIKCAGDALGTEELWNGQSLKPRQRLSVERKAIKWLRAHMPSDAELPEVVAFDKKTWTLVLSEVCPNGNSLQNDLQKGSFNPTIASKVSEYLAECHVTLNQIPPLWGSAEADRQHWKKMLTLKTTEPTSVEFSQDLRSNLVTLRLASEKAAEARFMNLNFQPKNIFVAEDKIGVIDFELSSSIGDPAYDFGSLLGHYIYWGLVTSSKNSSQDALQIMLKKYEERVGEIWKTRQDRVVRFAGATLFSILLEKSPTPQQSFRKLLMCTSNALLAWKSIPSNNANQVLLKAIGGHFDSSAIPF